MARVLTIATDTEDEYDEDSGILVRAFPDGRVFSTKSTCTHYESHDAHSATGPEALAFFPTPYDEENDTVWVYQPNVEDFVFGRVPLYRLLVNHQMDDKPSLYVNYSYEGAFEVINPTTEVQKGTFLYWTQVQEIEQNGITVYYQH